MSDRQKRAVRSFSSSALLVSGVAVFLCTLGGTGGGAYLGMVIAVAGLALQ